MLKSPIFASGPVSCSEDADCTAVVSCDKASGVDTAELYWAKCSANSCLVIELGIIVTL